MTLHVDFLSFLGYVNNDTMVQGKAFMFNVVSDIVFECILFVHPTAPTFVTVPDEVKIDDKFLINCILTKYKYEELLKYEN